MARLLLCLRGRKSCLLVCLREQAWRKELALWDLSLSSFLMRLALPLSFLRLPGPVLHCLVTASVCPNNQ